MKRTILTAALLVMLPGAAFAMECAADDIKAGKKVFKKCKVCHVINKKKNRIGPHLVGVIGRKAATGVGIKKDGTEKKFRYSKAMKKAAADGLIWTDENFLKYIEKPKKFIPKNRMAFAGIKKEKKRNELLCYVKSVEAPA